MTDIVNLRQFKKRKARAEKEAEADNNRKHHGVSSKLRKQAKAQNRIEADRLAGKTITATPPSDTGE